MRNQEQSRRQWRQRIEAQRRSGDSVKEFCRREGISKAGFYYWKRCVSAGMTRQGFVEVNVEPASKVSVEVPSPVVEPCSAIEIRLANGRSLLVSVGFDADHLAKLIAAVEAMA